MVQCVMTGRLSDSDAVVENPSPRAKPPSKVQGDGLLSSWIKLDDLLMSGVPS